jgi:hypothetical protein
VPRSLVYEGNFCLSRKAQEAEIAFINIYQEFFMLALILFLVLLFVLICLAAFAFWIWMLIDSATNTKLNSSTRLVWLLIIIFAHILGAIIYFFVGRSPKNPQIRYQYETPYRAQRAYPPYMPPQPQPQSAPYQPYQQGYQPPQAPPQPFQQGIPYPYALPMQQPLSSEENQYEQPQTIYPEQPQ